jgi:hypothetical protein
MDLSIADASVSVGVSFAAAITTATWRECGLRFPALAAGFRGLPRRSSEVLSGHDLPGGIQSDDLA